MKIVGIVAGMYNFYGLTMYFGFLFFFLMQFLSLLDSNAAFNCEAIRDCYEAFALYCFERYLIACLGMLKD